MSLPNALCSMVRRVAGDRLLLILLACLPPLLLLMPDHIPAIPGLVHWKTIGALAGLMVLSRGREDSGYLYRAGHWLLIRARGERRLAAVLVLFSAGLAAVVTNDVALFIVVPLTLGLRSLADLPIGRLIIFEALAVNTGSTLSPVGNPQNLYLWQTSGVSFLEFTLAMLPLGLALVGMLLLLIPLAFPSQRLQVAEAFHGASRHRGLLLLSLPLYPVFLLAIDLGYALAGALAIILCYLLIFRRVVAGVDWLLLLVFVLMFINLGLVARHPLVLDGAAVIDVLPGGMYTAGALLSQGISNVPAAIFLQGLTDQWQPLAWGVSIGGFGLAIGSLANLIALRLA
ncbi:MAG: transporter, partial [Ectothiorhodospiraceae bacterium]|nr:transporter [Ectothiorhodospiraceae bacterium]